MRVILAFLMLLSITTAFAAEPTAEQRLAHPWLALESDRGKVLWINQTTIVRAGKAYDHQDSAIVMVYSDVDAHPNYDADSGPQRIDPSHVYVLVFNCSQRERFSYFLLGKPGVRLAADRGSVIGTVGEMACGF